MITADLLRAELNAPDADTGTLERLSAVADSVISELVTGRADIPGPVLDHARLVTAADLYAQREAPNGVRVFADGMGGTVPVHVRASATARARAVLDPWLGPVIV